MFGVLSQRARCHARERGHPVHCFLASWRTVSHAAAGVYWIARRSLSSGRPSAGPVGGRWRRVFV